MLCLEPLNISLNWQKPSVILSNYTHNFWTFIGVNLPWNLHLSLCEDFLVSMWNWLAFMAFISHLVITHLLLLHFRYLRLGDESSGFCKKFHFPISSQRFANQVCLQMYFPDLTISHRDLSHTRRYVLRAYSVNLNCVTLMNDFLIVVSWSIWSEFGPESTAIFFTCKFVW